jgi:hypothetical protein
MMSRKLMKILWPAMVGWELMSAALMLKVIENKTSGTNPLRISRHTLCGNFERTSRLWLEALRKRSPLCVYRDLRYGGFAFHRVQKTEYSNVTTCIIIRRRRNLEDDLDTVYQCTRRRQRVQVPLCTLEAGPCGRFSPYDASLRNAAPSMCFL